MSKSFSIRLHYSIDFLICKHLIFRFSHGQSVRYVDLKEYNKPNFSLLNQIKHPVLAKQADNIWYKGRVVSSNFNDKTCQIQFEHNKLEAKCDFHDILPIEEGKLRRNSLNYTILTEIVLLLPRNSICSVIRLRIIGRR